MGMKRFDPKTILKSGGDIVITDPKSDINKRSQAGAGMSYSAKQELIKPFLSDDDVIIIDPEREYELAFIDELFGENFKNIGGNSNE